MELELKGSRQELAAFIRTKIHYGPPMVANWL